VQPEMRIAVVVPFLDEELHLGEMLASLAAQTRLPDRLLLVDDGSSDGSSAIAAGFAREHPWARVVRRPPRRYGRDRLAGGSAVAAFAWGVEQLDADWDVVAKVDADIWLAPRLLAEIERRFLSDSRLGMAGAYLSYRRPDGSLARQRCPETHVHGPNRFYRRACWDAIAPLPVMLGWDTVDEVRAQMRGWSTRSLEIPGEDPIHLRRMGAHDGLLRAHRRWGQGAWSIGEHPLHVLAVAVQRLGDAPPLAGSANYVLGWALAGMRGTPRAEPDLRAWVQRDQLRRLRRRVRGWAIRPTVGGAR
jgi:biofilm PGA synthesis N-glycosyltransferase PgaC